MIDFLCQKRFDITFKDFCKLVQTVIPSNYQTRETTGIYKSEYQPCSILEIYLKTTELPEANYIPANYIASIFCWNGKRGLTVLADNSLTINLSLQVLKNVKQNAEEFVTYTFDLLDEQAILSAIDEQYLIYSQLRTHDSIHKYIIREYVGDEVYLEFYTKDNTTKLYGDTTSLMTYMSLLINKFLVNSKNNQINSDKLES